MSDLFGYSAFDSEEWFNKQFWPAYPRRVAKAAAWRIAKRIVKDKTLAEAILNALLAHRKKWGSIELKYVPHPSTWLNQRRFEDEEALPFKPPSTSTLDPETERRWNERYKQREIKS